MSPITMPAGFERTQKALQTTNKIELPFPALELYWSNGNAQSKSIGGVQYFGGWGVQAEDMEAYCQEQGVDPLPGFSKVERTNDEGVDYTVYLGRIVSAAPFARRAAWFTDQKTGSSRSAVQYLCYLGYYDKQKKIYQPWGFGVLKARSFSGVELDNAVRFWERGTASVRKEIAADPKQIPPAAFFYGFFGTFGDTPLYAPKGKGKKSSITPCQCFISNNLNAEFLTNSYVGDTIATIMVESLDVAQEWLDDWNKRKETTRSEDTDIQPPDDGSDDYDNGVPF